MAVVSITNLVLSAEDALRLTELVEITRELSRDVRRPCLVREKRLAMSVGIGESICVFDTDGVIHNAQFSIENDRVTWARNDLKEPAFLSLLRQCHELVSRLREPGQPPAFVHWCSRTCHGRHG